MNEIDFENRDKTELGKAIEAAPRIKVGEEFTAFPDAARGIDVKVVIEEIKGSAIRVSDGRIFTKDQLLTDEEVALIRKKFSGKRFLKNNFS